MALTEIMTSKDGLIALHAYDSTKSSSELPVHLKPDALKEKFGALALGPNFY